MNTNTSHEQSCSHSFGDSLWIIQDIADKLDLHWRSANLRHCGLLRTYTKRRWSLHHGRWKCTSTMARRHDVFRSIQ